jgi:hypothetical protein
LEECAAVHKNNPYAAEELQQMLAAVISIGVETLAAVVHIFQHWLPMVLDTYDAPIENVFT